MMNEQVGNCSTTSIHSFPSLQIPGGPVCSTIIALLIAVYLFTLLARICDQYFVSCIKIISYNIGLTSDVAGATLMAIAVSSPDLFMNCVATFVTEGDLGIGTVVGVCLFNLLAVPALSVLLQPSDAIPIDYWSLTRDTFFFGLAIFCLILSLLDFTIDWYEGLLFVSIYAFYIVVLCCNQWIRTKVEEWLDNYRRNQNISFERWPLIPKSQSVMSYSIEEELISEHLRNQNVVLDDSLNSSNNCIRRIWNAIYIPIDFILFFTIPCPYTRAGPSKWYPVTFLMCLIWIAVISYTVAWMITITGYNLQIPDSLVGLTFIAVGMGVPEAAASVIVARQGHGSMALSNSLGANTFDILVCLGLPWVLKTAYYSDNVHQIIINSRGIGYSALLLSGSLILLYALLAMNKFKLSKTIGAILLVSYLVVSIFSALIELNIFFIGNFPLC